MDGLDVHQADGVFFRYSITRPPPPVGGGRFGRGGYIRDRSAGSAVRWAGNRPGDIGPFDTSLGNPCLDWRPHPPFPPPPRGVIGPGPPPPPKVRNQLQTPSVVSRSIVTKARSKLGDRLAARSGSQTVRANSITRNVYAGPGRRPFVDN